MSEIFIPLLVFVFMTAFAYKVEADYEGVRNLIHLVGLLVAIVALVHFW